MTSGAVTAGGEVSSAHRRPPRTERLARARSWLGPVLVAVLAGVLRFRHLGRPRDLIFDETYYAKDAWSMLRLGYEGVWPDRRTADPQLLAHPQTVPLSDTGPSSRTRRPGSG